MNPFKGPRPLSINLTHYTPRNKYATKKKKTSVPLSTYSFFCQFFFSVSFFFFFFLSLLNIHCFNFLANPIEHSFLSVVSSFICFNFYILLLTSIVNCISFIYIHCFLCLTSSILNLIFIYISFIYFYCFNL